ncbi:MAG: hypothetical protein ACI85I_001758 [Arenicella sp.]|jgi:hypothetical protein
MKHFLFTMLLTSVVLFSTHAQTTSVTGKVTDSDTGEGMPFVNVFFQNTTIGATTDFEGRFQISSSTPTDSLVVSYVGYLKRAKFVEKGKKQVINFQLRPESTTLKELVITYGDYENPAWEIMRNVMANKKRNDKRSLDAYQFDSYSKIEVDVDNISEKFRQKKIMQKIIAVLDSIQAMAGEDGKPILPIFISESISEYYHISGPDRARENIVKTKLTGVGLDDGSLVSQLIGSSFQQYNFYRNWLSIAGKDFISPLADSWKGFYNYELEAEGENIKGYNCYRISFKPKRPEDLAFTGTMWVTDSTFALKQIDLKIGKDANLNFIEKVVVQQEMEEAEKGGAWLPSKSRILLDIGEIRDDWAGMLAKFYVSNKNYVVNKPQRTEFYEDAFVLKENANVSDNEYWKANRHDTLSVAEQNVYHMIDTIRNLPVVKNYVEIADILFNGYKTVGKFDIGPYAYLYANNNVEGHRVQLGFKSNADFSKKFIVKGFAGYGFDDKKWKYSGDVEYIASRKHWTKVGVGHSYDLYQIGIFNDNLTNNTLFNASTKFGKLRRPFMQRISKAWIQTDLMRGWTQTIALRQRKFEPINSGYDFQYKLPFDTDQVRSEFTVSELILETRIAFKQKYLQNDNARISLGNQGRPIITLRATLGIDSLLGSSFSYKKVDVRIEQNVRIGLFGRMNYELSGGYVPDAVPYPLLEAHLGNESLFFNRNSFNLMDFFEFVSDEYATLRVKHSFEGLILNRIPLMRKLKWRSFATANVLYGSIRQENIDLVADTHLPNPAFQSLEINKPYAEVGYGIENIFRFIRVDFIHRLTYLDRRVDGSKPNSFGVFLSVQFKL